MTYKIIKQATGMYLTKEIKEKSSFKHLRKKTNTGRIRAQIAVYSRIIYI
jgi:hypothetical protein